MNYQRPSDGGWGRAENTMAPRQCSEPGPIAPMDFTAAVYRNPILWGAAIALAVSGLLGMVTL